jgi:hypothetical protein
MYSGDKTASFLYKTLSISPYLIPYRRISSGRGKIFSFPQCADWLWGPPSLIFNGYWASFSGGKAAGA